MASAGRENRRGSTSGYLLLFVAFGGIFLASVIQDYKIERLEQRAASLEARAVAAETKLRAVTWLAERRLDPAAVRADSLRRACYAQVARNGGADCGL